MLAMFQVIPMMWRAVRPSRIADMPAVVNSFWLRSGYEAITFFGMILTHSQKEADRFNAGYDTLKNHEMIHLRQAQSTGDSWCRFYLIYIGYWLAGLRMNRKLRNAAYLLNPFELEAYGHMHDLDYLKHCQEGATEWRHYARMPLDERLRYYQRTHKPS